MCVSVVDLELVICCRGAGETRVLLLASLSVQTSSNMVGKKVLFLLLPFFKVPRVHPADFRPAGLIVDFVPSYWSIHSYPTDHDVTHYHACDQISRAFSLRFANCKQSKQMVKAWERGYHSHPSSGLEYGNETTRFHVHLLGIWWTGIKTER